MTHVAIRTNMGAAHDHAVRNGTASPSPVREIALFDSEPLPSIEAAKAILVLPDGKRASFVRRTESDCDFTKIDDSATATIYSCLITADVEFNARSFAIILENGIIWGYGVIYPERGGFYKYSGVHWELKIAIVDNDNTTSTFTYSPLDVASLRKSVLDGINLEEKVTALIPTIVNDVLKQLIGNDGSDRLTYEMLCYMLNQVTSLNYQAGTIKFTPPQKTQPIIEIDRGSIIYTKGLNDQVDIYFNSPELLVTGDSAVIDSAVFNNGILRMDGL